MATAQHTQLASRIDQNLDYLTREWEAIPPIASEWDEMDEADRFDFVIEWPLREDALHQLRQWDGEGSLSASQQQRFDELQARISQHRATLERLLED